MANEVDPINNVEERDLNEVWGAYRANLEPQVNPAELEEDRKARGVHATALPHITPHVAYPSNIPLSSKLSEIPAVAERVPHPTNAFAPTRLPDPTTLFSNTPALGKRSSLNGMNDLPSNKTAKKKATEAVEELGDQMRAYVEGLEAIPDQMKSRSAASAPDFPHPALAGILAAYQKEGEVNEKLLGYVKEMDKLQKDLGLLLDLNAKLNGIKEDVKEMPADLSALLDELKERGMDIWPTDNKAFSKEIKDQIKSMSSGHQDKAKSNLHVLTTAKIQHLTSIMSAIWECMKDFSRRDDQQKQKALRING
jgi:hypothetical protein